MPFGDDPFYQHTSNPMGQTASPQRQQRPVGFGANPAVSSASGTPRNYGTTPRVAGTLMEQLQNQRQGQSQYGSIARGLANPQVMQMLLLGMTPGIFSAPAMAAGTGRLAGLEAAMQRLGPIGLGAFITKLKSLPSGPQAPSFFDRMPPAQSQLARPPVAQGRGVGGPPAARAFAGGSPVGSPTYSRPSYAAPR